MYLRRIVRRLESGRNERIRSHNSVHEIRASLNHTLIDKFAERLILAHIP